MTITARMKESFFDRSAILRAVDAATVRNLSKAGRFVQVDAQRSQKPKKPGVYSPPGTPPYSHVEWKRRRENRQRKKAGQEPLRSGQGFRGLRQIYFVYEPTRQGVIVGPVSETGGKVTQLMEFGGSGRIWNPRTKRHEMRSYAARPFMRPAFNRTIVKLAPLWRDSIRPGVSAPVVAQNVA